MIRTTVIRDLAMHRPLFTSRDVAELTGASPVDVARALHALTRAGLIVKLLRGTWANTRHPMFSPYLLVGHLREVWQRPAYVSFVSALHLHGMLSQIPPEIHVAVDRYREELKTPVGTYIFHKLQPALLTGDQPGDMWGRFQIASPEKALFDTLYLSLRRGRQWRFLPEIELPRQWDWSKWNEWLSAIDSAPLRHGMERLRKDFRRRHLHERRKQAPLRTRTTVG